MKKSKELAFLNFLRFSYPQENNFSSYKKDFDIDDIQDKMDINKKVLTKFLNQLKKDDFLDFSKLGEDKFKIEFKITFEKLLEFINPHELDSTIEEIEEFVFKYIHLFDFQATSTFAINTAQQVYPILEKDPNADISSHINSTLVSAAKLPETQKYVARLLFTLSDEIEKVDQKTFESIFFYFFTVPFENNPFVTTLFLFRLSLQLEALKKQVKWENIIEIEPGVKW